MIYFLFSILNHFFNSKPLKQKQNQLLSISQEVYGCVTLQRSNFIIIFSRWNLFNQNYNIASPLPFLSFCLGMPLHYLISWLLAGGHNLWHHDYERGSQAKKKKKRRLSLISKRDNNDAFHSVSHFVFQELMELQQTFISQGLLLLGNFNNNNNYIGREAPSISTTANGSLVEYQ